MTKLNLIKYIRDVPDFPKEGIIFKDISPILNNPRAYQFTIDALSDAIDPETELIVSPEARGFLFGPQVALKKKIRFVMVRKTNKLPGKTISADYQLEYGLDSLEMIKNLVKRGTRVSIIDDILATGGSANAIINLVAQEGGKVVSAAFIAELKFLKGADQIRIPNKKVTSLISY